MGRAGLSWWCRPVPKHLSTSIASRCLSLTNRREQKAWLFIRRCSFPGGLIHYFVRSSLPAGETHTLPTHLRPSLSGSAKLSEAAAPPILQDSAQRSRGLTQIIVAARKLLMVPLCVCPVPSLACSCVVWEVTGKICQLHMLLSFGCSLHYSFLAFTQEHHSFDPYKTVLYWHLKHGSAQNSCPWLWFSSFDWKTPPSGGHSAQLQHSEPNRIISREIKLSWVATLEQTVKQSQHVVHMLLPFIHNYIS